MSRLIFVCNLFFFLSPPADVETRECFSTSAKDSCWVFPTLFTCGDHQGGWSEDSRQMEATGSHSQVQVEMLGEFLPDVAENVSLLN